MVPPSRLAEDPTMTTRRRGVFGVFGVLGAAAACATLFAACGGGGGMAPATVDLTGHWLVYLTPTGLAEIDPSAIYLGQSGNTVDGAGITGIVSGNVVSMTSTTNSFATSFDVTATSTAATGTFAISGSINVSGTMRLAKFSPTGTLTATGSIRGSTISLNFATAAGSCDYSDAGLSVLEEVDLIGASGAEHFEIDFTPGGLAVGTLSVPTTVAASVVYRTDTDGVEVDASTGSLTVTQYDGSGFAVSFTLTLTGGGTITGTLTVVWDIAFYEP
jgi:hypothetical protein